VPESAKEERHEQANTERIDLGVTWLMVIGLVSAEIVPFEGPV
jgi:hypothetical protein